MDEWVPIDQIAQCKECESLLPEYKMCPWRNGCCPYCCGCTVTETHPVATIVPFKQIIEPRQSLLKYVIRRVVGVFQLWRWS